LLRDGGRRRYYLIMIALASAGAICVRTLLSFRAFIGVPCVFNNFVLLDFPGTAIDAITINRRTRLGNTAAFSVVDLTKRIQNTISSSLQ